MPMRAMRVDGPGGSALHWLRDGRSGGAGVSTGRDAAPIIGGIMSPLPRRPAPPPHDRMTA